MYKLLLVTVFTGQSLKGAIEPYLNGGVSTLVADFPDMETAETAFYRLTGADMCGAIQTMPFRLYERTVTVDEADHGSPFHAPRPERS